MTGVLPALRGSGAGVCGTGARERRLRVALGALWLLDGGLQLQPVMYTRSFVTGIVLPSTAGSPAVVADPVVAAAHLVELHVAAFDIVFACIQLALGLALVLDRAPRAVLGASLVWSAGVWLFGESLGGLFSATASPLTGAPGAVALYGVVALVSWPVRDGGRIGLLSRRAAHRVVGALWLLAAALLARPANLAPRALGAQLRAAASGEPGWLARPLGAAAAAVGSRGSAITLALVALMALVGTAVVLGRAERAAIDLSILLAAGIWVFGEACGGLFTGTATDPNSAPLLVLLALALLPARSAPATPSRERAARALAAAP